MLSLRLAWVVKENKACLSARGKKETGSFEKVFTEKPNRRPNFDGRSSRKKNSAYCSRSPAPRVGQPHTDRIVPQDMRVRQQTIYNSPGRCKANGNWQAAAMALA